MKKNTKSTLATTMRNYLKNANPRVISVKARRGASSHLQTQKPHPRAMLATAKCSFTHHSHNGAKHTHAFANHSKLNRAPRAVINKRISNHDIDI